MVIQGMSRQSCIDILARAQLGRLACVREGQPYITPMSIAYDSGHLYAFSTFGQKIAWMRENPLVCVEVDEVKNRWSWATLIIFGRYEELPKGVNIENRTLAYDLFQRRPVWWEPGYAKTSVDSKTRPLDEAVFFRIQISEITGHQAVPDK